MSDDETVFLAAKGSGGSASHYHCRRDCVGLSQAVSIHEYDREQASVCNDACSFCYDVVEQPDSQATSHYQALRDAEPGEVFADAE